MPEEVIAHAWEMLDSDGSGDVSFAEFDSYIREYGLQVDTVVR